VPRWADFAEAAPEIAEPALELLERFRFVFAGTIRRDGTPRISPVEAHVVRGELVLVLIRGTLKARDVLRDPRLVLNTPVLDAANPGAEVKLRGRVVRVADEDFMEATAARLEAASGWRPDRRWHVFTVDLHDVAHIAWKEGVMTMTRWTPERGVERVERPLAVLDAGG
jgi:hypothetical protein